MDDRQRRAHSSASNDSEGDVEELMPQLEHEDDDDEEEGDDELPRGSAFTARARAAASAESQRSSAPRAAIPARSYATRATPSSTSTTGSSIRSARQSESKHRSDDEAESEDILTPGAALARESVSRGFPTLSSLGGASAATHLTQTGAQLLLLDVPAGIPFGIDYSSFVTGAQFKGMKMIPPGVHYVWYSSSQAGGDMAPRVGFFLWMDAGSVLVRRWSATREGLEPLQDEDEAARYIAGAKRFDFDSGQGAYPVHSSARWASLSNFITREVVARFEPVGKLISSFDTGANKGKEKYRLEDKFAEGSKERAAAAAVAAAEAVDAGDAMSDVPSAAADSSAASSASSSSTAGAASPASSSSAAATPTAPKFAPSPSTSFYSTLPTPASFVAAARLSTAEARASLLSALHLDSTPLLDALLASYNAPSPAEAESMLLGEIQFSFVTFLIGQDAEGFLAWKGLTTLLCSCGDALEHRHALIETWIRVLAAQLNELPRDFFIDPLSGDNFLVASLQRIFDASEDPSLGAAPMSLHYALREIAELVRARFLPPNPPLRLPAFRQPEHPSTAALREAARRDAEALAQMASAPESKQQEAQKPPQPQSDEQRRAADEAQRRAFLARLQADAEDDEFAPTVADE